MNYDPPVNDRSWTKPKIGKYFSLIYTRSGHEPQAPHLEPCQARKKPIKTLLNLRIGMSNNILNVKCEWLNAL